MSDYTAQLAKSLTPCAPPRVIESVYTDSEFDALMGIIKTKDSWETITGQTFTSVDELMATVGGTIPPDHGLTLDDLTTPTFRGYLAKSSVCLYPEAYGIFYNSKFLDLVKDYWGCPYARPTHMLFNVAVPQTARREAHLDALTFRGVRSDNTPVWLLNIMGKSGLFTRYLVKMGQVITWWYRGAEGTFTYWPDGPLESPKRLEHPLWNRGVVVENELMYHRGDSVGEPSERDLTGVIKARSRISYSPADDTWIVTTDGEHLKTYRPEQIRFLSHWNGELYSDLDELKKVMDHTDDITHQQVVDTLLADMRSKGVKVAEPSDPFRDVDWIQALMHTYAIAPTTDWLAA